MRILIVDDSASMRAQLRDDLEEAGVTVAEAKDGAAALALVRAGQPMDLIITDVNMPDIDGLSLVEKLRARPSGATTPIFVLSAERAQDSRARAKELGVAAWIVKPYVKESLLSVIRRLGAAA